MVCTLHLLRLVICKSMYNVPTKSLLYFLNFRLEIASLGMPPGTTSQGDSSVKVTSGRTPRFLSRAAQLTKLPDHETLFQQPRINMKKI